MINQDEFDRFNSDVVTYGLQDNVFALGEKQNPYPYLLHSNLLVCTSESEACPMIFIEAKALHVPICTTNFGSACEFVQNGINGEIAPIEEFGSVISNLIQDTSRYRTIRESMIYFRYDNNTLLEQIYSIL